MAIPRAKKKKPVNVPKEHEQKKIMEANQMCIATAAEQLYEDKGWRTKRINNLINAYWNEMEEARRLQNECGIVRTPRFIAKQAEELIDEPILKRCELIHKDAKKMDERSKQYKREAYALCVGCLVKALRKLKVSKLRCKMIVAEIFINQREYQPWSVYEQCANITGLDVRDVIRWDE